MDLSDLADGQQQGLADRVQVWTLEASHVPQTSSWENHWFMVLATVSGGKRQISNVLIIIESMNEYCNIKIQKANFLILVFNIPVFIQWVFIIPPQPC